MILYFFLLGFSFAITADSWSLSIGVPRSKKRGNDEWDVDIIHQIYISNRMHLFSFFVRGIKNRLSRDIYQYLRLQLEIACSLYQDRWRQGCNEEYMMVFTCWIQTFFSAREFFSSRGGRGLGDCIFERLPDTKSQIFPEGDILVLQERMSSPVHHLNSHHCVRRIPFFFFKKFPIFFVPQIKLRLLPSIYLLILFRLQH